MKKYIFVVMMMLSMSVNAETKSESMGRISTDNGTTVRIMAIEYSTGDKNVFMYVRDKYGVKKVSASMTKYQAKRLIDALTKAVSKID